MATTKTILSRILFLLYLISIGMICFMSATSIPAIQRTIFGMPTDKVIHFCMFFPFPILAFLSFEHKSGKKWKNILFVFVAGVIGAAVAGATEVIQDYLPTRAMDLNDFYSDVLAIGLSSLLVILVDITRK